MSPTRDDVRAADEAEAARLCATLTEAERGVLTLCAKGFTAAEVGALIGRRHATVERHKANFVAKLAVGSTIEAAVVAAKAGLV